MKTKLISLFLILTSCAFGQISFEKGYYIDNENNRIDCLIKNTDWEDNPKEFKYKIRETDDPQKGDLTTAKEFGIIGISKFIRVETRIDRSPLEFSAFSDKKDPLWSQEQLFLKVLVEGKACLYSYMEGNLKLYFYSVPDSTIKQLVYKNYKNGETTFATNYGFRLQLWSDVRSDDAIVSSVEKLNYQQKELEKYFINYNKNQGETPDLYHKEKKTDFFHLKVTPGVNYSTFSITNKSSPYLDVVFKGKVNFRLGLEGEFILPINKNKWSILFEPTYHYFNSTGPTGTGNATVNYSSIEFPVGLRHYFFLNENLKIFINGMYLFNFGVDFNTKIDFDYALQSSLNLKTVNGLSFGGGVCINKLSAELRYYTNRNLLFDYELWSADYQTFSLIVGYKIF
jgi:hypothetical protein